MSIATILRKLQVTSVSELQKNPSKALDANLVMITKNGKKLGIYLSKEEFENLIEELLPLKEEFTEELDGAIRSNKKSENINLNDFLDD